MEKSQLDNLINFCFNFHFSIGVDWRDHSPGYILEKWNKYIGVHTTNVVPDITKQHADTWIKRWRVDNDKWNEIKGIVYFLMIINQKRIIHEKYSPSDLIKMFEENVGDRNDINKEPYIHFHVLVKKEIGYWLDRKDNHRDYNLNLLV